MAMKTCSIFFEGKLTIVKLKYYSELDQII